MVIVLQLVRTGTDYVVETTADVKEQKARLTR